MQGTMTRQRQCHLPQNGGQACVMLPGGPHSTHQWNQTRPCPQDGCPNATCSGELVFWPCAPCPLTCDDISDQTVCPADRPCSSPVNCGWPVCLAQCPGDMVFHSAEQCRQEGGPCSWLCLVQGPGVECTSFCAPGCTCPPGLFLHNASCLPRTRCPCQMHGHVYEPGAVAHLKSCTNCGLWLEPLDPVESLQPQLQRRDPSAFLGRHCAPGSLWGCCMPGPQYGG
uniref:Uncharacterized protein n=1 Tax=Myotis myotis TaxID=51298 RepID=A0A7J7V3N4_MYOMY|nr:hypothetical protein mMyoMyo1_008488 [Myotis myotis]